jgi:hypothetical protein
MAFSKPKFNLKLPKLYQIIILDLLLSSAGKCFRMIPFELLLLLLLLLLFTEFAAVSRFFK